VWPLAERSFSDSAQPLPRFDRSSSAVTNRSSVAVRLSVVMAAASAPGRSENREPHAAWCVAAPLFSSPRGSVGRPGKVPMMAQGCR